MSNPEPKTGAHGWPLVPSKLWPGEMTLSCPKCASTNVTLFAIAGQGGRIGSPGTCDAIRCNQCQTTDTKPWRA